MGALKQIGVVAWSMAIAAGIGLTAWSGFDAVGKAVTSVGWGMMFVVLTRALAVSVAGAGWWLLFPERLVLRVAVLLRFVRESVNTLLPLTQVGGDVIGGRLLTFWAVPGPLAAASLVIDVLIQASTQFLFATLGLLMLVALRPDMKVAGAAATGMALAIPMLGAFYLAQRRGGHRILRLVLARLKGDGNWRVVGTVDALYQYLSMIYGRWSNIVSSSLVHLVGWLIGVAEVLIVLSCMGHPVTIAEGLVIESLLQAVRGAAFAIPSALGAQEAGLILLCGLFGIPPDQALALSLLKRAADLALGVPGLVALQVLEGEHLTANCSRCEGQPRISLDLPPERQ